MIGTTISHYKIIEKLGDGGMGVVYKAQDTKLRRLVALKFLLPGSTHDKNALERFINEAQTASALDHANICTIFEINEHKPAPGNQGKQVFIAMAYYEGETLKNRLNRSPLSAEDTIDITIQIAQGLERAHEAGIMHRDIKSENIIVTNRGEAKILDFGIAKLTGRSVVTSSNTSMGTVAYMSPEQVQGEKVDHRTDIWSLGVTIHEMLTGQLPFEGEYNQAVMYAIVNETPQRLQTFRPELSPNLQIILDRALEKDPSDRYQSAREMIAGLVGLSDGSLAESRTEVTKIESNKVRYLPDYQNDVFVSYSYIDDKPLTKGHKGWIENFHTSLEIRLEQLLGEDTRIWRDDKLDDKKAATDDDSTISPPNAAILISMISPQYVKSKKCLQEVKEFYKAAEQGKGLWINNKTRIFKAVKTYVPRESQPEELQNIPDYEFYRFDPESGRPQEFWPELGAEANRNFWVKLEDIAYDIYLLMETIKKGGTDSLPKKSVQDKSILYLAETTPDLAESRDEIKRQLQQRGHPILPDQQLISNADGIQNKIRDDLKRCSISIHLVGKNYGLVPEGETSSIADIQHQLAIKRGQDESFLRFIWIPPGLQPVDENQQKFVESLKQDSSKQKGAHILQTPIGEFQTFLKEKMSEKPGNGQKKVIEDNILRIYLQCDQADIDATDQLEEYLFDQGFEIKLPAFGGTELEIFDAHKENLLMCDATIIYYGNTTDSWLSTKLADLQKITGYGRSKPMKAKAIYFAAPETKHKQRFRTREAITIKNFGNFSPDLLVPFLDAIKNGSGEMV